jgi:hypothetical protein
VALSLARCGRKCRSSYVGAPYPTQAIDELCAATEFDTSPNSDAIADSIADDGDGDVQLAITRAEGALQSARSFVMDRIRAISETALAGDVPDDQQRSVPAREHAGHARGGSTSHSPSAARPRCAPTARSSAASATSTPARPTSTTHVLVLM